MQQKREKVSLLWWLLVNFQLMIMIFQLSDWFPKPIIWAIIIMFDQIRKNWWRISCAEILEVGKKIFAASSVKKMSRFEEVPPEKIKRIAWKLTKTVILLGLAGYELIYITNSAYRLVGYIYQLISDASSKNTELLNNLRLGADYKATISFFCSCKKE